MEGEVVAAVVKVLVQNIIDHSKEEFSLVRGLKKEAKKLGESMATIQKYLNDAEKRTITDEAVKSWLKRLENVAFDADNVLDELNYHHLCKQIKPIKPVKQKVLSFFSPFADYSRSRSMALKIKEINEDLEVINNQATDLRLQERIPTDVPTLPDPARETDCFTLDPIFIGRDEEASEIVEKLTDFIATDEHVSILAIVGMGGLGKTTLTRKVFHLLKQKNLFGSHFWVHVSQIFDPIILFKKILNELSSSVHDAIESSQAILENTSSDQAEDQSRQDFLKKTSFGQVDVESRKEILKELTSSDQVEVESRQEILNKIQEALKDKSYLLILDDIWNEDLLKWENFINSLKGVSSTKGNVIVVTNRTMGAASTVNPHCTQELKELSEEDCFSIIKEKSYGKKDFPSEFEAIGRKIAKRCKGLPLAANVVGGVLRNKSKEKWISIEEKWLAHNEGAHITNILRLSFDELCVPSLKKCFAYCSVFPKGRRFEKQELIEYWMGEGFLETDENNDLEFVGENFFNILLDNSLLQIARRYYGEVEYVMHDLVHDLACSVLGGSHYASYIFPVRYMILEERSKDIVKKNAKYLQTLLVMDNICGNMFSEFKCLHVLTFESDGVIELPSSIRKLIHLRVLNISGSRIERLPDWIGELLHLQTLRAEISYLGRKFQLPSTLKYLINLRHLCITKLVDLPAKIGLLTSLRTLKYFKVGDKSGYKIEELGSLKDLNGKLEIFELEKVDNKEEAEKANLHNKSKLVELHLVWDLYRQDETTNDENVLEGLQPHSNMKKLKIEGFKGKRFPSWSPDMAVENVPRGSWLQLDNLIEISLLWCTECEEIPMFGQLPNLKSLCLKGFRNVNSINSSAHKSQCIVFPALENLILYNMPRLTEWVHTDSVGVSGVMLFPRLEYLEIKRCNQLTNFPALFCSPLKKLTIEDIGSYRPLASIFEIELTLLTELRVIGINDLECLPNWLFESNPNISNLEIVGCPNLRGLPNGLCSIKSLEKLIIIKCPNLEHMGVQQSQGSLTCLKELHIKDCNVVLYLPCVLLGSSLERLRLENLSSVQNVPEIIDFLPKLARLSWVRILGVPQFSAVSESSLNIDVSMIGSMEIVDGILQGCSIPISGLKLKGREGWESLPKSIQTLTALEELKLENFGMEELPDWLGNFSSLRELEISNCNKLRRLPMDVIQSFAKLRFFRISECPGVCFDISQWPYISHIAYIAIDRQRVMTKKDDAVRREKLWRIFLERRQRKIRVEKGFVFEYEVLPKS